MSVTLDIATLVEIVLIVAGLAAVWGTIRTEIRQIARDQQAMEVRLKAVEVEAGQIEAVSQRIATVENLSAKVERIDPLIERVSMFERHMGEKVDGIARSLEDLRNMLYRAAAASRSVNRP